MLDKLRSAEERYENLSAESMRPEIASDPEAMRRCLKELNALTPVVEKYREFRRARQTMEEARALLEDKSAAELHELAGKELRECRERCARLQEELKILLLPRDPNDDKNVIMEIRAGAGGEEAALFAGVLYRMYTMYASSAGFRTERISANETGLGGFKEITFSVEGDGAYSRLKYESGVHRVQRVPETESSGRIHTSTVTVAVLPEAEDVEIEINPADLKVETMKSSGAGGQHINKTESAVRMIHLPTGMVVECQEERSQFKNRDKALRLLKSRLYDQKRREQEDAIASQRRGQVGSGDRSERIRTYNYPQGRVTDHRIALTLYTLDRVLDGDIGALIDALATADNAEKLRAGGEGAGTTPDGQA